MFQKFGNLSSPETAKERVASLRAKFSDWKVDAILIPRSDEYLGEYVPENAERLAWITSFTGSAGSALVLEDEAIVFTDGRYTSQVVKQCDPDIFQFEDIVSNPPSKWIREKKKALKLGVDPWTFPSSAIKQFQKALDIAGGELVMLPTNPIDAIWKNRPKSTSAPISIQPLEYAGKLAKDKIASILTELDKSKDDAIILADPLSVCWLLNIRGGDVMHTPLTLSRTIVHRDKVPQIFIDKAKLDIETNAYLKQLADIHALSDFERELRTLGSKKVSVQLDENVSPHAIKMHLEDAGATIKTATDPISKPRAVKNASEIKGAIEAHKVDGVALVEFLSWLSAQNPEELDEIKVASKLEASRASAGQRLKQPLKEISFDTISGSGPNAAIIHYRVDEASNRNLRTGEMILIDSGGQYEAGTTDITRTIGLGDVPDEQKKYFTLVLKGMINISLLKFPEKTRGIDIDAFARASLWKHGVDYAHGTGHGVGSYLSVHEGPQSISKRSMVEFEAGMILSNEPGYYREGAFGIRIENLIVVEEAKNIGAGEVMMHEFSTLTLCPIDRNLIVADLLTKEEMNWLNAYHQNVEEQLSPLLSNDADRDWLKQATAPLC